MAAGSAEVHFAKKLANNEKKTRDKAVRKLRAWLSSRPKTGPGFKEVDLLKLWKGLFYCMWMSDKPLVQEELGDNISKLTHSLKNLESAVLFIKTFFKTMCREWHGIDRLRIDKFYLFIRLFVYNSFALVKNSSWDDSLMKMLVDVYSSGPLSPNSETVPDGIKLHLCLIYLPELKSVIGSESVPQVVMKLLDPLLLLAAKNKSKVISRAVKENVLDYLVKEKEIELDKDVYGKIEEDVVFLQIDCINLVERLTALAADRDILGRNRNQLYHYVKRFRKLSDVSLAAKEGENTTQKHSELANIVEENGGIKNDTVEMEDIKKKKKTKKRNLQKTDEVPTKRTKSHREEEKGESLVTDEHGKMNKKKKKKRKNTTDLFENSFKENKTHLISVAKDKEGNLSLENKTGLDCDNSSRILNGSSKKKKTKHALTEDKKKTVKDLSENHKNDASDKGISERTKPETSNNLHTLIDTNDFNNGVHFSNTSHNGFDKTENNLSFTSVEDDSEGKMAVDKGLATEDNIFAVFRKEKPTPPAFLRKAVSKTTPGTKPRKHKVSKGPGLIPKSDPAGLNHKRVRIALSKNTAQTTHDYRKSLTDSPHIPFDADKTPKQGLLKAAILSASTHGRSTSRKRPRATDFF